MAQADGTIIIDTELDTDGAKKGSKELESQIRSLAGTVDGVGVKAKAALNRQVDAFSKLNNEYAAQEKKVSELRQKVEEFAKQKIPTDEYKELQRQLEQTIAKWSRLQDAQDKYRATGGKSNSNVFRRRQYDIDQLANTVDHLKSDMQALEEEGNAYKSASSTKEAQKAVEQLEAAEMRLADTNNRLKTSATSVSGTVSEYKRKLEEAGASVKKAGGMVGWFDSALNGLKLCARAPGDVLKWLWGVMKKVPGKIASGSISLVTNSLKVLGSAAARATKKLASMAGSAIVGGLKKLSAGILGIHKTANKSTYSMGTMIKNALVMGALYKGISGASAAIKSGFENLAQYSGSTNNSISMLWSSLERLKNSLATAFAPVLNIVAPILTKFINMISTAVSYVGAFVSALTGKSTYTKAVGVQKNYAASLKDTASGAKDAAKETEKAADAANDYLSPLDDINKFSEDNKSSSSSPSNSTGGGAGGIDPSSMFTEAPIESNIKGLAQKIKDLIKNEDFEGLGAFLAEQLNAGMAKVKDAISWEKVGPQITYFVNAFTTTFNSLVDNLDWDLLGRTIGTGVNTIVNALDLLITGIDWKNLGAKFAEGINGLVDEIDFYHLGELIGHRIMIWPSIVLGFVTNLDWRAIGNQLGKGLNGVVNSISLSDIGAALGRAITGIFRSGINFSSTFDWLALGSNIASGVNNAFANTDFATVAQGISKFVTGCIDTLQTFIAETDWHNVVNSIETFFANIDWLDIATKVISLLMSAFGAALGMVLDLLIDLGKNIIEGIKVGLNMEVADIWNWIKEHIFQPFIDGFKNAFGIHSPSTVMQEQGHFIIEGLLNGITDLIAKFREKFNELKTIAVNKLKEAKDGAVQKGKEMRDSLVNIVENIREKFHNGFQSLVNIVKNPINHVLSMINSLLRAAQTMQNNFASALNSMNIELPGWLEKLTGFSSIGFNIGYWRAPQVPYLAQGAVIPPNKEFMAVLGDQKSGNNIEAPEALIRKIVREESGNGKGATYNVNAQINRRTLFTMVLEEGKVQKTVTGRNPFETI